MDKNIRVSSEKLYDGRNVYVKHYPCIMEDGIYTPCQEHVLDGVTPTYRLVISKEMFVEAYNKWIKGENDEIN